MSIFMFAATHFSSPCLLLPVGMNAPKFTDALPTFPALLKRPVKCCQTYRFCVCPLSPVALSGTLLLLHCAPPFCHLDVSL